MYSVSYTQFIDLQVLQLVFTTHGFMHILKKNISKGGKRKSQNKPN